MTKCTMHFPSPRRSQQTHTFINTSLSASPNRARCSRKNRKKGLHEGPERCASAARRLGFLGFPSRLVDSALGASGHKITEQRSLVLLIPNTCAPFWAQLSSSSSSMLYTSLKGVSYVFIWIYDFHKTNSFPRAFFQADAGKICGGNPRQEMLSHLPHILIHNFVNSSVAEHFLAHG